MDGVDTFAPDVGPDVELAGVTLVVGSALAGGESEPHPTVKPTVKPTVTRAVASGTDWNRRERGEHRLTVGKLSNPSPNGSNIPRTVA